MSPRCKARIPAYIAAEGLQHGVSTSCMCTSNQRMASLYLQLGYAPPRRHGRQQEGTYIHRNEVASALAAAHRAMNTCQRQIAKTSLASGALQTL